MGTKSSTLSPCGTLQQPPQSRSGHANNNVQAPTQSLEAAQLPREASTTHPRPRRPVYPPLSEWSSPAIPDSLWFASDFMVGAGMVVFQPSTRRVVLLRDAYSGRWFLPKGRKDVGESLEQAALREAYEESGFQAAFLPLLTPTKQPAAPDPAKRQGRLPNTEPIFVSTLYWPPRKLPPGSTPRVGDDGGEYLTYWFVGQIAEDAKPTMDAQMADEGSYITHLMSVEDALRVLAKDGEALTHHVVAVAHGIWQKTNEFAAEVEQKAACAASDGTADISSSSRGSSLARSSPTAHPQDTM